MKKEKAKRKLYFRALRNIMKIRYKKPRFIYLGEPFENGALILSNHEGTDSPMSLEIYCDKPIRMWGSYEMNSGLVKLYKYQTKIYYHEKKHWNLHLARLFCLIASPLTCMFYKGINLISTYRDIHFTKTISESIHTVEDGKSIVIFPEISDKGYLDVLEGFHLGFTSLGKMLLKKGMDVQITVAYYRKSEKRYVVDKPVMLSEIFTEEATREEIARKLCDRCNELGQMDLNSVISKNEESEEKLAVNH